MSKGDWLGEFELCVMLAVGRLNDLDPDQAYGVSVRRHIEHETGRAVSIGAIYTTLGRLEEKGLVRFRLTAPAPVAGGRARKIFRLTPEGHRLLAHAATVLSRLIVGWRAGGGRR